ncbi:MAG: hypothetical protein HC855_07695 [Rhizobiales bacterium]|nr:hypothetical protein [Hyphomicrobiales bacterium]
MRETDLYRPVKRFLEAQGYAVKAEIESCDVVAVRGKEPPMIVELKTGFSLQLLLQGIDRQAISDAVYLAVAEPKREMRRNLIKLCRRLGLGLLTVRGESVEAHADPTPYSPRKNARRKAMLLKEFAARAGDPNLGGTSRAPLMTAYRQDALRCARVLRDAGQARVADIRKQAHVDRASTILLRDVYGWFIREARGVYALTPSGQEALAKYAEALRLL